MKYKQFYVISIFILLTIGKGYGQESLKQAFLSPDSLPTYPTFRKFGLSYDLIGNSRYTTHLDGTEQETGKIQRGTLMAYGTFNLLEKEKFSLSLTELCANTTLDVQNDDETLFAYDGDTYSFYNFTTSLNFTYKSRLFGKPFIGNVSVMASTQDFMSLDKISGLITGVLVFQKNPNTRYTLGLAAIADLSASVPAFPVITYWHRFKNPLWELNVILPKEIKLRRAQTLGGWMSIGSEYSSQSYFVPDLMGNSGTYENRFTDMKFGLSYDRIFWKRFMLSCNVGYNTVIQNNLVEVYKPYKDKVGEIDYKGAFYERVGISYLFDIHKDSSRK